MIFDAHLDLAMNALDWNRDLRWQLDEIRAAERHLLDRPDRGRGTVSFPEMRKGGVGVCVATQIARFVKPGNPLNGWRSPEQAWAHTQAQLAWYREMEACGELVQITNRAGLEKRLSDTSPDAPLGYILSLEGADSLVTLGHLEGAYAYGLRAVGPAHYGPGTYAQGTAAAGGIGRKGRELLREMEKLGMILDVTHLCDESFWEALDHFSGPTWASHHNCRALVPGDRQLSDEQIRALIERGAVIGGVLDAWMLVPSWVRGFSTPQNAGLVLETLVDHLDHICQIAGNADHIGIGSDLDGGFGVEQTPTDLRSIADLATLPGLLAGRGYATGDIDGAMGGNFLRFLKTAWKD